MENSPALAFIKDEEGRIVYMNQSCEAALGGDLADLKGKSDFDCGRRK